MAETIKGINVTIGSDTTGLAKALSEVNAKSRDIQSELKQVEKLLKLDPTNTELVAQKQQLLGQAIANAAQKLETLKIAQAQVNEQFAKGQISEGQYRAFQRECEATEQQLESLQKQLEATKKSFDLGDAVSKASSSLKTVGKQMTETGKTLTESLTVPIAGAVAGIAALTNSTAETGDALDEMAARTGFSVEALSEYKYAAGLAGVELDGLETSVKKMQNTVTDAGNGLKTAATTLEQLGLSSKSLKGLSPEQQFDKIASAVASVEDPTRRAALAQDVFGKSGTQLLPMLADGAQGLAKLRQEAKDLGIAWTSDSAKAAAQYSDDLARVKAGIAGVFQGLAVDLIPVLRDQLFPAIQEYVIPVVQKLAAQIGELIKWFASLDPRWQAVILAAVGFAAAVGPLLVMLGALVTGIGALLSPIGLVVLAIGALIAVGVALATHWDVIKAKAKEVWEGIVGFFKGGVNTAIGFVNGLIAAAERMVNAIAGAFNLLPTFTIPSWVPLIGGKSFGLPKIAEVTFPKVPLLAEGAVFTRPTLGVLGEAGTEAALPLSQLQPMMTQALIDAIDTVSGKLGSSRPLSIPVTVNGVNDPWTVKQAAKQGVMEGLREMALTGV